MTEAEVREYCRLFFNQTPEKDKQINMIRYTLNEIAEETCFHIENKYARIGGNPNSVQILQDISELKDQLKEVHEKIELLKRMNRIFSNCLVVLSKDHLRETFPKGNAIDEF
ncbi:hypothetical protein [Segatella asaccharophila]